MPVLQDPGIITAADLEALAGLDVPAEYVVVFNPPRFYDRARDRLTRPGFWELMTVDDYDAGDHAIEEWTWDAPRDTPAADLTAWVTRLLGMAVELQHDEVEIKRDGLLARWHKAPLYWVLRNN